MKTVKNNNIEIRYDENIYNKEDACKKNKQDDILSWASVILEIILLVFLYLSNIVWWGKMLLTAGIGFIMLFSVWEISSLIYGSNYRLYNFMTKLTEKNIRILNAGSDLIVEQKHNDGEIEFFTLNHLAEYLNAKIKNIVGDNYFGPVKAEVGLTDSGKEEKTEIVIMPASCMLKNE